jgi:hypothetical protein
MTGKMKEDKRVKFGENSHERKEIVRIMSIRKMVATIPVNTNEEYLLIGKYSCCEH